MAPYQAHHPNPIQKPNYSSLDTMPEISKKNVLAEEWNQFRADPMGYLKEKFSDSEFRKKATQKVTAAALLGVMTAQSMAATVSGVAYQHDAESTGGLKNHYVTAVDEATSDILGGSPTDDDGNFSIDNLPIGDIVLLYNNHPDGAVFRGDPNWYGAQKEYSITSTGQSISGIKFPAFRKTVDIHGDDFVDDFMKTDVTNNDTIWIAKGLNPRRILDYPQRYIDEGGIKVFYYTGAALPGVNPMDAISQAAANMGFAQLNDDAKYTRFQVMGTTNTFITSNDGIALVYEGLIDLATVPLGGVDSEGIHRSYISIDASASQQGRVRAILHEGLHISLTVPYHSLRGGIDQISTTGPGTLSDHEKFGLQSINALKKSENGNPVFRTYFRSSPQGWLQQTISPEVSIVAQNEGNSGQTVHYITLTRSGLTSATQTTNINVQDITATFGEDHLTTSGQLTFKDFVLSMTYPITILGDNKLEGDEEIGLILSENQNKPGKTLNGLPGHDLVFIIQNDDEPNVPTAIKSNIWLAY